MKPAFGVIGSGSWGTALAAHLAHGEYDVQVWGRDEAALEEIQQQHTNQKFLPDVKLPVSLKTVDSLEALLHSSDVLVLSVPSSAVPDVLENLQPYIKTPKPLVLTTKGFAPSGVLLHEYILKTLPQFPLLILSGPSFAKEVALGLPTAVNLAAQELALAETVGKYFSHHQFRVECTTDLTGVQLGGAIKNVLAIAMGIMDGLGYKTNTISALITFGLREALRLATVLGAKSETMLGLSGLGDLVLTGTDNQSRNRRYGFTLGAGQATTGGYLIEGALAAQHVIRLAKQHQINLPICERVLAILEKRAEPSVLLELFQ